MPDEFTIMNQGEKEHEDKHRALLHIHRRELGNVKQVVTIENPSEMLDVKNTESVDVVKSQMDQSLRRRVK